MVRPKVTAYFSDVVFHIMESSNMKELKRLVWKEQHSSFGKSGQMLATSTIVARYRSRFPVEVKEWELAEKYRIYGGFKGKFRLVSPELATQHFH